LHYYQFNIGDYASHTRGLSLLEDLAYRRLIDEYYLAEHPLNGCSTTIAKNIGFAEHETEVAYILNRFFQETSDGWVQERIEKEIFEFKEKQEKCTRAGKASGASRQTNRRSTDVEPNINQEPITNNHKPKIQKPDGVLDSTWNDFVTLRKSKKAAITQTALNGIYREAMKAGISFEQALRTCCERDWRGFKAEWIANLPKATLAQQSTLAAARTIFGDERNTTDAYIIESHPKALT